MVKGIFIVIIITVMLLHFMGSSLEKE